MVEYDSQQLDNVFKALADPTRREMLGLLVNKKSCTISELAEPFSISFAATSKHVKVLEKAGLLSRKIVGRTHLCTFSSGSLAEAEHWISYYRDFWHKRLNALESLLKQEGELND
ncbi:hypothetical protein LCGC14_1247360 [marine sediment metagenome]|uniref:HTH arsR-type domain-containing protein n=1 Tax=marine sediment metagenome TaxID=412755 RepID=A0A0F9L7S8_9ZZZZ|nr:transcriptional regulator [Methylophaga sp.]HEC59430.1 transcriptional regulator [Methylophaga sp.]